MLSRTKNHGRLPLLASVGVFVLASVGLLTAGCGGNGSKSNSQRFTLRIENVSTPTTLATSDGGATAIPLAPGVVVVHTAPDPLFTEGEADRGEGLEAIAEDGDPSSLGASLMPDVGVELEAVEVFNTPVGADAPGPLFPGDAYEVTFSAQRGDRVSFATMFVQSNDLFFGPDGAGIELFDRSGRAISGDVTDQTLLWDAGTEVDQEPGLGADQAPRQTGPDTGADDPDSAVRLISIPAAGVLSNLPAESEVIRVTITPVS